MYILKLIQGRLIIGVAMMAVSAWSIADDDRKNIIVDIINAPVVSNGLVAGAPTEFNAILSARDADERSFALDPEEFGHQIPAGGRMEIQLTGDFTIDAGLEADPSGFLTNGHVILTSGPQNPIHGNAGDSVQLANWTATLTPNVASGGHLITITPDGGNGRNGLEGERAKKIGVKVVHVRPRAGISPFTNGAAGEVGTIAIRIYNASGKLLEAGVDDIVFTSKADTGPQAAITNIDVRTGGAGAPQPTMEVNENTDFQRVAANTSLVNTARLPGTTFFSESAPYAPRFLLLEAAAAGEPNNTRIVASYSIDPLRPWLAEMTDSSGQAIGVIRINGPSESSRGSLLPDPATGSSIFSVPVQVGDEEGIYTVTVSLTSGNESVNTIFVDDEDD